MAIRASGLLATDAQFKNFESTQFLIDEQANTTAGLSAQRSGSAGAVYQVNSGRVREDRRGLSPTKAAKGDDDSIGRKLDGNKLHIRP